MSARLPSERRCIIRRCELTEQERIESRQACPRCTENIRWHLRQIEAHEPLLRIMPTLLRLPGRADVGRRFPGYRSTPPPGLLESLDAFDPRGACTGEDRTVLWRLESACRLVLEERRDAEAAEPRESYSATLEGVITYLLWTAEWCAYQPWVGEHASNIASIHAQVRGMCHDQPPGSLAPCLVVSCSGKVYWSKDVPDGKGGTLDAARCAQCGRQYFGTDLYRLRTQEAS